MSDAPRPQKSSQGGGGGAGQRFVERRLSVTERDQGQDGPKLQLQLPQTGAIAAAAASGSASTMMPRASRVRDSITKDSAPRKWICKQVPVKTLGGEMMMPIWFS
ncbi:hypothetical protein BGZ58_004807, partial [Dissophora ornata]